MLKNEKILLLITEMEESHQLQIKEYVETIMKEDEINSNNIIDEMPSPLKMENKHFLY